MENKPLSNELCINCGKPAPPPEICCKKWTLYTDCDCHGWPINEPVCKECKEIETMTTDPIIKQRLDYLEELKKNIKLLEKDISLIKAIFADANSTFRWFLNGELIVSVFVDEIKEITPLMKSISKTGKFKRRYNCKQASSLWIVYLHKESDIDFIIEAPFVGTSCHYVDTGKFENKPILKLVCN